MKLSIMPRLTFKGQSFLNHEEYADHRYKRIALPEDNALTCLNVLLHYDKAPSDAHVNLLRA